MFGLFEASLLAQASSKNALSRHLPDLSIFHFELFCYHDSQPVTVLFFRVRWFEVGLYKWRFRFFRLRKRISQRNIAPGSSRWKKSRHFENEKMNFRRSYEADLHRSAFSFSSEQVLYKPAVQPAARGSTLVNRSDIPQTRTPATDFQTDYAFYRCYLE